MSILLLGGSPALPSSSSRLLQHIGECLALLGHRYDTVQVRDLPAEALLHADWNHVELRRALALVAQADAVVIATPVYKASFSGLLKTFLDLLPQDGLAGKLVLPVATGGSQSHMLALDYALRPVLAALSARHVLASIYATSAQLVWHADADIGASTGLALDPAIATRVGCGVAELSEALSAVLTARAATPAATPIIPAATTSWSGRSLKDFPYAQNGHA